MIAAGGSPLRISGNARRAREDTSVKSHRMASPKPKPSASPCTSAIVISEDARSRRFNSISRDTSAWIDTASRPARSRPVQNTAPRARMRSTRADGSAASPRSTAIIASNIGAVISLPPSGLFRVKVNTAPARSIRTLSGRISISTSSPEV